MAIAKMKRFTLLTFAANKERLLKELQIFGEVHFMNLSPEDLEEAKLSGDISMKTVERLETELEKVRFAMSKIEPHVKKPGGLKALTAKPLTLGFDEFDGYPDKYGYNAVYERVKAEDESIASSKAALTKLKTDNENLRLWLGLDIAAEELDNLKYVKYLIGTVNKFAAEGFLENAGKDLSACYIEVLGNLKDDTAVLTIVPAEEYENALGCFKELGFSRLSFGFSGVPAQLIERNNESIAELQKAIDAAEENIGKLADEYERLSVVHDYYESALGREWARAGFLKTETSVMLAGWVPEDESGGFGKIVARVCGNDYYLEEEDVEKDSEDVPIKLKNNKFVTAFEGLTETFSMPKYNDIDPTPLLTPFYFIYFGFMLGDAGYGLILIVAAWAALKFCHFKPGMRRFIKFFFYLGFSTIFAGIIYGSAFGQTFFTPITLADGTKKAILDSQLDVVMMMLLAVGIGVFQMLLGLAVKGYVLWRNGDPLAAIFDAGFWIVAVSSGLGWLVAIFGIEPLASVSSVFMWVFYASLFGLAATQGRASKTVPVKIVSGIYSVYGMTSYIGDLVSYTRIAALALSGAYISFAFNIMANLFPAGPVRIIFGTLVYLIGLALNLGLSALGAYVHTLRLQYVEFFSKFYEGGGVPFNPFKLKNKFINIKEN